ncbi:MAG: hypothetical protein UU88_C0008G0019 [Parcubacteria group bacterium GW2011_GWC1_42_11]|uniref:Uncharacterized protein n=1 Tax=Candidatus Nomurabacteria bacterium GW2011_GWC2_42_20 TaxID=1618756 RepID=A0A0G0ZHQ2_9BACT|nr:MAG: hypothetical protein UU88_C0008G0019 [Parcubacteria group bacterium GW2011_GWC1_42_11]KKS48242.1 MAG: hypothetical protein UV12_C0002G0091 [Candidatus Nomurabacteria bacterium GW2011_GWC2_42_20]KKS59372.1 MAG: hypothetical protein UV24_C0002G0038 [Candidatus Nomurabacteria bacterium GW2011_GWA2_42_41]KKT09815.1 MAG: hypothetical protein UV86_C0002G0058 [Candidatus Nomurabacteria bacterium GW2011_GWB1_43_20]TAN36278.1 MAG: hypothetical protein EPN27_02055 [Patescibacteria group bacterium
MNNPELREALIKELGIGELPTETQDEIVDKLGEVIFKSLTVSIFEKLSDAARVEFEKISATGDNSLIQKFLEENIPDMQALMEEEIKKTMRDLAEIKEESK